MMTKQFLTMKKIDESTIVVGLNRPDKRNALSLDLMSDLCEVFEALQDHPSYRVIVLTGEGKTFCAGLDLQEAADINLVEKMSQHVARLLTAIYSSKLVTIAALQGSAIAGGAGLVAACDCAVMAINAQIGFPETRRGLVAAQVAPLLRRQISMRDIRELLLVGNLVDAERALSMGLVNRVVEPEWVMTEALNLAERILLGAPEATKETKRLLDSLEPTDFYKDMEIAISFHHAARHSAEAKEGIAAFLEKREPSWK